MPEVPADTLKVNDVILIDGVRVIVTNVDATATTVLVTWLPPDAYGMPDTGVEEGGQAFAPTELVTTIQ